VAVVIITPGQAKCYCSKKPEKIKTKIETLGTSISEKTYEVETTADKGPTIALLRRQDSLLNNHCLTNRRSEMTNLDF